MIDKPASCDGCPLKNLTGGFVPNVSSPGKTELIVGEAPGEEEEETGQPFVGGAGSWLNNMLKAAGYKRENFNVANTMCCRPPNNVYPTDNAPYCTKDQAESGLAYCRRTYLDPFIAETRPTRIISLGEHALNALTGREGITLWRGSPLPLTGQSQPLVIPTLHPAFLMRQATLTSVVIGDLKKHPIVPPENYNLNPTIEDVRAIDWKSFSFDFEWDAFGKITLCGLTNKPYEAIVVPFQGEFILELRRIFENAEELIGQNIVGADTSYIEQLGWDIHNAKLWDTMLMQHLVQPDMRHGLAFIASVFTNKVFWKGKGKEDKKGEMDWIGGEQWKTWDKKNAIPRELGGYGGCKDGNEAFALYNARDTDGTWQAYQQLRFLLDKYNLHNVYSNISVPLGFVCRDITRHGLKIDKSALVNVREELDAEIKRLDGLLPDGLRSFLKEVEKSVPNVRQIANPKNKTCKGSKKNPHEQVLLTFEREGETPCPSCGKVIKSGKLTIPKTIKEPALELVVPWNSSQMVMEYAKGKGLKEYLNPKTKSPSADKNARKVWGKDADEFLTVDQLKIASTLKNSFVKPGLVNTDRMYYNLLVHGTGEGRLSSTGKRPRIDLNIQNIPEEVKRIFVPDKPDWWFIDNDIGQGENKLTAWFAEDWERLERLADLDYDEHSETATACFGVDVTKSNQNKHLRKAGKIINHMLNYGAGWKKLQEVLMINGFVFTALECKELIAAWKMKNAGTAAWQERTIALAGQQGYLENPFGRRRWFQTRDLGPKALAFLPASTLADCVLRMMIAMHADKWGVELDNLRVSDRMVFTGNWRMVTQVHDSIVATGPRGAAADVWTGMKRVMTQSWEELNGFGFTIESKICRHNLKEGVKVYNERDLANLLVGE